MFFIVGLWLNRLRKVLRSISVFITINREEGFVYPDKNYKYDTESDFINGESFLFAISFSYLGFDNLINTVYDHIFELILREDYIEILPEVTVVVVICIRKYIVWREAFATCKTFYILSANFTAHHFEP